MHDSKIAFKAAGLWQAQRAAAARTENAAPAPNARAPAQQQAHAQAQHAAPEGSTGALHALASLLRCLTSADADGRVVVDPAAGRLKFLLLDAAAHFGQARHRVWVCERCRCWVES
jgi:hypothetical protein